MSLTREDLDLLIDRYTQLYEAGKAIRGSLWGKDGTRCVMGVALDLNLAFRIQNDLAESLVTANNTGMPDPQQIDGWDSMRRTPVLPSGFAQVIQILKDRRETLE